MKAETVNRVLELLYDRGEGFFSLAELAEAAKVDGRQLDRAMEALRERGHEVESALAHGVRLIRPTRLDSHLIERNLGTHRVGRSVICFEEVGSTNDVALDSARQGDTDGLAVLAEFQTRGRGRQGRAWIGPPRANILLSVLLVDPPPSRLPHEALTIAAGLAVAEGIEGACGLRCSLKWPNDVLLDGQKLAGVLVELRQQKDRRCVVLGVGINANAAPPADQLDAAATCLAEHCGCQVDRTEPVRAVLRRLDHWVGQISQGRLKALHDAWLLRCGMLNERATVTCGGQRFTGRILDVSPMDGLVLCCDDGQRVHLPAKTSTIVNSAEPTAGRQ